MRKLSALAALLIFAAGACMGSGRAGTSTVLVDFSHDEFASAFIKFFPGELTVGQGAEITFRQTWTGEPHTVTGGTLVDELMDAVEPYKKKLERGEQIPEEPPKDIAKLEKRVVWAFGEGNDLNQTGSQPCYLSKGEPRKDGKPCRTQEQPDFTGKQTFYNSGIIPYEGAQGNEYRVKLGNNIDPGSYWFYCIVHGEFQSTKVNVRPSGSDVPSQAEVNMAARKEIDRLAKPLIALNRDARDKRVTLSAPGEGDFVVRGNFAGLFNPSEWQTTINEFIPRRIRAKAGDKITWNVLGRHTISFGVPRYFPIIEFQKNGTVRFNPRLGVPAGGAKRFEIPEGDRPPEGENIVFDGGSYDGTGFWSSGMIEEEAVVEYSMRINKPGTYRYACLVHPPMVGSVVIT